MTKKKTLLSRPKIINQAARLTPVTVVLTLIDIYILIYKEELSVYLCICVSVCHTSHQRRPTWIEVSQ